MRILKSSLLVIILFIAGCGSIGDFFDATVPTQTDPFITRISPASAKAGDAVTVFGMGFSAAAALNIVVVEGVEVAADSYTLLPSPSGNEVESITFTVPAGISTGAHSIYVIVIDNPSNTNVSITITP